MGGGGPFLQRPSTLVGAPPGKIFVEIFKFGLVCKKPGSHDSTSPKPQAQTESRKGDRDDAVTRTPYPGSLALVNPETRGLRAALRRHERLARPGGEAGQGDHHHSAQPAPKTSRRLRASATSTRSSSRRRHHRREGQEGTGRHRLPIRPTTSSTTTATSSPINLPDHVASTIVQVEVEIRDKIVKDDEGNPPLRASPSRRSSAPTRWPG